MNKLVLSEVNEENNLVIDIDTEFIIDEDSLSKSLNIIVESDVCLHVLEISSNSSNNFIFSLGENSRLVYDKIGSNINDIITVNLDGLSSSLELRSSITSNKDSSCDFIVRHNASKTISSIVNHGANTSVNKLNFNVDIYVPSSALGCVTNQQNKIINTKCGKSTILPNLIIDTDDVVANHSAFIGDFDNDIIFYLKSRGLDSISLRNLLMRGFLLGNVEYKEEYTDKIEKLLKI